MGRRRLLIVAWGGVGSMYLLLQGYLLFQLVAHTTFAADLDVYPELTDAVIYNRIQNMLTQLREKQFRILQSQEQEVVPQFTYHFPEEPNLLYHSDLFAVPPSDSRYYQPEVNGLTEDDKRLDVEIAQPVSPRLVRDEDEDSQVGTPVSTDDRSSSYDVTSEATRSEEEQSNGVKDVFKKLLAHDDREIILIAVIAGSSAATLAGLIFLFYSWYRLNNKSKAAADVEYPAYGVTGPNKEISPTGDRRLAQSAQMYHYQHQKQQIIAMESNRANNERRGSVSEGDSDEENEEGDYTVYECPGLAATGELEVKNPLFQDDPTPATGNHANEAPPSNTIVDLK